MLTRLRVQGFKSLLEIDVRFGPFTCIAGPNGAGKSNLFDAMRFLHLLTQHPIMEAAKLLREAKGRSPEPRSLFTAFGDFRAPEMRFTADLLIERKVEDDFGVDSSAAISALRYTLAFRLAPEAQGTGRTRSPGENESERLELALESLSPITLDEARREMGFPARPGFKTSTISGRRVGDFISTSPGEGGPQIKIHQEGHGGRTVAAPRSTRTVVNGMASSDFPTILAVHRELETWSTLLLEPSAMRAPSYYSDPRVLDSRGANLPGAIARLCKGEVLEGQTCAELANSLANLIADVREIRIKDDEKTETLTLEARGKDGVFHRASSLSDGTLRFLVLATLAADPKVKGLLCLEEPENGIHPERIPALMRLLREIAVDPARGTGEDNPLRQVVISTHSPAIFNNINHDDLIYFIEGITTRGGATGRVTVSEVPPRSWRAKIQKDALPLSLGQVNSYIEAARGNAQLLLGFDQPGADVA
ncbi:MAG: AAA family ATPase [Acidobacteriota bacterium]|nr:AAA family ATPase [Acidobacteriota bacterium]